MLIRRIRDPINKIKNILMKKVLTFNVKCNRSMISCANQSINKEKVYIINNNKIDKR